VKSFFLLSTFPRCSLKDEMSVTKGPNEIGFFYKVAVFSAAEVQKEHLRIKVFKDDEPKSCELLGGPHVTKETRFTNTFYRVFSFILEIIFCDHFL
jgi:hypothetical protein